MTDLSKLSDDDLLKMYQSKQAQPQAPVDVSALSDEELMQRYASKQAAKPENPMLSDFVFGDTSASDYGKSIVQGAKGAAKSIVDPAAWKSLGKELTSFPDADLSKLRETPITNTDMSGVAMAAMPITAMSGASRAFLKPAAIDTVKQATLEAAGKSGYSVPRSYIKQSWLTNLGERFGGKQAIEATAQIKGQPITNRSAARALDLSDDTPITPDLLSGIRKEAGKAYEAIKGVGVLSTDKAYNQALKDIVGKYSGASKDFPELANQGVGKLVKALNKKTISAEGAIEQIKNLRDAAKSNLGPMASSSDKLMGKAQRRAAEELENLIERNITPVLGKQVLNEFRAARQAIATTYSIEKALNPTTGNVLGTELAKQAKKGVPLTGPLKEAANFARAFPRLAREPMGGPASGGALEPLVYGTAGTVATGGAGAMAAAIPIIGKPIARYLMTTVPKSAKQPINDTLARMLLQRGVLGAGASTQQSRLAELLNEQNQR